MFTERLMGAGTWRIVYTGEGDWQLPPPDDDHAGEDVE